MRKQYKKGKRYDASVISQKLRKNPKSTEAHLEVLLDKKYITNVGFYYGSNYIYTFNLTGKGFVAFESFREFALLKILTNIFVPILVSFITYWFCHVYIK